MSQLLSETRGKEERFKVQQLPDLKVKEEAMGQGQQWPLEAGNGPRLTDSEETGTLVLQPQGVSSVNNPTEQEMDFPQSFQKGM